MIESEPLTIESSQRRLEQLRTALDEHSIVSMTDAAGTITFVNDKFCTVSGYRREELLGRTHRMVKSGQHSTEFYQELWGTISAGSVWHGTICNRRRDGGLYWVEATIVPLMDAQGSRSGYISIRTDITELKRKEEALRISDERLRRSQVFANIGTWDWNIQSGHLYWSERIAPLFGYPNGELETSYANFLAAIHPDDRGAVQAAVDACVARDVPYDIEHRVIWPDGSVRWLQEKGAVIRSPEGAPLHMLGVVQDIDVRKRAELALAEREQQLSEAQTLARLGHWQANLETGELFWSREIFHIFGCDPNTFTPTVQAFQAMIHPDDREQVATSEQEAGKTGVFGVEHRIVRPDGTLGHVFERGRAEFNDAGQMVKLIGTVQDITDRVLANKRLRESEERFAFAVEGAGDGIWDWNIETGEMPLSGHYEAMLGFDKGEIPHTIEAWIASVHPDDLPRVRANLDDYLAGRNPNYVVELRLRCKDGSYKWVLCRGTVVGRNEEGAAIRMIGIHSDISATKATEERLALAKEEAERANQAKSDFLSSMSHELRTPMNAVIGFAQMLEYDGSLNEDQQDNVHEILKAGRHLLELINEVLDLAKVESGHVDLSLEPLELRPVLEESWQLIQPLAEARQLKFQLEVAPDLVVRADRVRLKQVLLNLLSNSVKYNCDAGSIFLAASSVRGNRIRIRVTDTGVGIPAEQISQLFQPFNRLGQENNGIEGTGIGLTITRRLVEMMAGTVGVESQEGQGSTFWIDLPQDLTQAEQTAESAGDRISSPQETRSHNVLCIDDNPANLKLITQILALRPQIQVITAHTAELGTELALAHRPQLVLLDINLPRLDGYQVLDIFKTDPRLKHVPVVAITANAMPRDIERGLAAGFAHYLTKPLEVSELLGIVDRCLLLQKDQPT